VRSFTGISCVSPVHQTVKYAGSTDKKAILQAYDQTTGEILGHTQFIRQI